MTYQAKTKEETQVEKAKLILEMLNTKRINRKHALALIVLVHNHNAPVVIQFSNGNIYYIGRNYAYKWMKHYGFEWAKNPYHQERKAKIWIKSE